jgi:hypothetical protein
MIDTGPSVLGPTEKTILPGVGFTSRLRSLKGDEMNDRIRQRAYELWLQSGEPEGSEMEFWLQAEREIKGEGEQAAGASGNPIPDSGN